MLQNNAPTDQITLYDQHNLALYAALLDADVAGVCWQEIAASLMGLDPDVDGAECCWRSHLERARWIVGEGLAFAVEAFGQNSPR